MRLNPKSISLAFSATEVDGDDWRALSGKGDVMDAMVSATGCKTANEKDVKLGSPLGAPCSFIRSGLRAIIL